MLPVTDLWLPDYKADDDALHVKFTGVSNKVIRENLKRLVAAKAKMEVCCLAVPNCTDGAAAWGLAPKSVLKTLYYSDIIRNYRLNGGK